MRRRGRNFVPIGRKHPISLRNRSIVAPMRKLAVILSTVALLAAGTAIAVAGGGGWTGHGNASYHQYHPKPPCPPHKPDYPHKYKWHGYGWPSPPKGSDCPKPPCPHKDKWSSRSSTRWSGSGGSDAGSKGKKCGHYHHDDDDHYGDGHGHDNDGHYDWDRHRKGRGGRH